MTGPGHFSFILAAKITGCLNPSYKLVWELKMSNTVLMDDMNILSLDFIKVKFNRAETPRRIRAAAVLADDGGDTG